MNIIFDFDGTICDSFNLNIKIANEYLSKFKKKKINPHEFREKGIEEIIKEYRLNKLQILLYIYKGRHDLAKHINELKSFDGMPLVIKRLSRKNTLGIVSSNSKTNIDKFLKQNNLDGYFKFIISSLSISEKGKKIKIAIEKYSLDSNDTFYVGDEVRDIEAAKKLHLRSVAVGWGFTSKKLLKKFNPDYLLSSPEELTRIVE